MTLDYFSYDLSDPYTKKWMIFVIMNVASMFDTATGQGKTQIVEIVYPNYFALNSVDQDEALHMLSGAIGVTQEELRASLPH